MRRTCNGPGGQCNTTCDDCVAGCIDDGYSEECAQIVIVNGGSHLFYCAQELSGLTEYCNLNTCYSTCNDTDVDGCTDSMVYHDPDATVDDGTCEYISAEYTVDIIYETDADVAGFQFNVDGAELISASGGAADAAGFTVSTGGSTVLGFSFVVTCLRAGSGVLTTLTLSGIDAFFGFASFGVGGQTLTGAEVSDVLICHIVEKMEAVYRHLEGTDESAQISIQMLQ